MMGRGVGLIILLIPERTNLVLAVVSMKLGLLVCIRVYSVGIAYAEGFVDE